MAFNEDRTDSQFSRGRGNFAGVPESWTQPDWEAVAVELSLALDRMTQDGPGIEDFAQARQAQARYHAASR